MPACCASGKGSILVADQRSLQSRVSSRIFRPIDESDDIAVLEIAEPLHLVNGRDCIPEALHDLCGQLETDVHPPGADVKQDIPRGGDRMAAAGADLSKRVQLSGPRVTEELIPRLGAKPRHAGETGLDVTELHSANDSGEIRAERTYGFVALALRLEANH
jgi:hypothetical protein